MDAQSETSSNSNSPAKQKITCKGCGKRIQLLLSHLERTTKPCKALYDMEALRAEGSRLHKEQMARRNRERYHTDPNESTKKKAASKEYYEKHSEEKKGVMTAYNEKHKEHIAFIKKEKYGWGAWEKHECPVCEKRFSTLSNMKRHISNIHSYHSDQTHHCFICDTDIKYKDNLDRHIKEVHGEEKKFKCDKCPAAYIRKEDLEKHKRSGHHHQEYNCEYCKKTLIFRYAAERERHIIHIKCDHSHVYDTTCQGIVDQRIEKANMRDRCFKTPNHAEKDAVIMDYYKKNKNSEEKKSASKRLFCEHPEKEEKIMNAYKKYGKHVVTFTRTQCDCETHRSITCCSHHKLSHYTNEGYIDCHPFGATCYPGCDDCGACISELEEYKRDLGIEYENKFGYKKIGKYDFQTHWHRERQRFWRRKVEEDYDRRGRGIHGWEKEEWNGEEWKIMDGYYDCLFCKRRVDGTTKEQHLIHNKNGILTCASMKKKNEGPFTPCCHMLCKKCGGRTEKDPWEKELCKNPWNCKCEDWIKKHPESQILPEKE